jgi:NAD(P)-dependent dehydrogenase (short-subunit alcohol dehydrogenase family)
VLITDARHIVALPLARTLAGAGAASIHIGLPEPWKPLPLREALLAVPGVRLVELDVTSERSVADLAAALAGKIEIVVNTADLPRPGGLLAPPAQGQARAMSEVVALGLMRLARAFGPAMTGRGADGDLGAVAWVNLLSVFGCASPPDWAGYGAAHAAALALSRALRAELGHGGVRLVTVLTGPTEDAWFQTLDPPHVAGSTLAGARRWSSATWPATWSHDWKRIPRQWSANWHAGGCHDTGSAGACCRACRRSGPGDRPDADAER